MHRYFMPQDRRPDGATPLLLRNVGDRGKPVFTRPQIIRYRDGGEIDLGHHICAVWPTDLDGDGHFDLIAGAEDGKVYPFLRQELTWPGASPTEAQASLWPQPQ